MPTPATFATLASQIALKSSAPASTLWNLQAGLGQAIGIDAVSAWTNVSGKGVSLAVFDDGDKHATAVSGIINAQPTTNAPLGIAYGADLTAFKVVGTSTAAITKTMASAASFDVTNNSWGWDAALYVNKAQAAWSGFFANLTNAAEHGRDGLGTVQVVAAGNVRASGGDANLSNFTNDRHLIAVGAVTSEGKVASYSNPGAALLVSAPSSGGLKAITTTDLAGSAGYAAGDVTTTFGGTSAAAPQVSATVALMLEANPNLGWRDVKTILAYAAEQPRAVTGVENAGTHWNGGGLSFSNDTGFGVIDARTAVRLAETWREQKTSANELNLALQATKTQTLSADGQLRYSFSVDQAISVESAEITLQGSHARVGDLVVQLISPEGTVSTLLNKSGGASAYQSFTLSSNAFLGEGGTGQWTLQVSEGAGAATGTFTGASLALHGASEASDTFVFTDAYAGGAVLHHGSGHGILNAAASTGNDVLDLHAGATSTIAGQALVIDSNSLFTTAVAGDGTVKLVANDAGCVLVGGHGNATFVGGAGDDTIVAGTGHNLVSGGVGFDTLVETGLRAEWSVAQQADGSWHLQRADGKLDLVSGVEQVQFADQTLILGPGLSAPQQVVAALDPQAHGSAAALLYGAAFDRGADAAGLSHWTAVLDAGTSLKAVAQGFLGSAEFAQLYGSGTSDASFVEALYQNALHRAPDAAGLSNWMHQLGGGAMDRADLLVAFSQSPENMANHTDALNHGLLFF